MAFILANQSCAADAECGVAGATVTLYLTETSAHCSRMVAASADLVSDASTREATLRQECADLLPDIALMACFAEPVVACEGGRCRMLPQ